MAGEATTDKVSLLSAETITSDSGSSAFSTTRWRSASILVKVASTGGTLPVLALTVKVSDEDQDDWYTHPAYLMPYAITADGNYCLSVPGDLCDSMKVTWAVTGTSATFTVTMDAELKD